MAFTVEQSFQFLQAAFNRNRLPHALLLNDTGNDSAFALAARLISYINKTPLLPLDDMAGEYCKIVRPKSKTRRILVDDIRNLEPFFQKRALGHHWKIGIFPETECLNEQAANAFLKTLEEPPQNSLIILITAYPQQLMQTIRSRCVRLDLYNPSSSYQLSDAEKRIIPSWIEACRHIGSETSALLFRSELSLLLASLKEEIKSRIEEEIKEQAKQIAKTSGISDWAKQMEDVTNAHIESEYLGQRDRLLDFFIAWFGDILRLAAKAPNPQFPEYQFEQEAILAKHPIPDMLNRIESIELLKKDLQTNVQEQLALDVRFLQILA